LLSLLIGLAIFFTATNVFQITIYLFFSFTLFYLYRKINVYLSSKKLKTLLTIAISLEWILLLVTLSYFRENKNYLDSVLFELFNQIKF
jgi:hypothetical protein